MKLEKLELGNFKAFGDIQAIDLKPLTLLFGANSAGKSTILQSLIYLSEVFKQANWDIYSTRQGGEFIDFGGLQNIVHQKDLNNTIHFGLTVSGFNIVTPSDIFNNDADDLSEIIDSLLDKTYRKREGKFEQNDLLKHQVPHYECSFTVRFGINPDTNGIEYFSIIEEQAVLITYSENEPENVHVEADGEVLSITRNNEKDKYDVKTIKPFSRFFVKRYLFDQRKKDEILGFFNAEIDKKDFEEELIGQIKKAGIENDDDQFIAFWINDDEDEVELSPILKMIDTELNNLNSFFGFDENIDASLYPIENQVSVREFLSDIIHMGYFRPVPERFIYKTGKCQADESGIDDVWSMLLEDDSLRFRVNKYLSEPDKLDMGYQLEVQTWNNQLDSSQHTRKLDLLEVRDLHSNTIVNLRELGQGVVQIIPILASILSDKLNLVSIEQPELHLHPGLQSRIGKIFTEISMEKSYESISDFLKNSSPSKLLLIEIHSEHIVKAIQLEVAKQEGLTPEIVNILYIQKDHEKPQSIVRKLSLDEGGSFTEPWPDDFFELSSDLTLERLRNSFKSRN